METNPAPKSMRQWLHEIIYEADTPAGRLFDYALILSIITSVVVVMLDSVEPIHANYGSILRILEWSFTILFTLEYALRLYCVAQPLAYARSFYGIVDVLAILPTYISLLIPESQVFIVIRILRLLRVFRVLKLVTYVRESEALVLALRGSLRKIIVFLYSVLAVVVIIGSLMYVIEGEANGFTSIPRSMYWAIVTLTTVGYGDIAPQTPLGQAIASMVMVLGYGIIAVPTGIVTVEMNRASKRSLSMQACPACSLEGHDTDAEHCKYCGAKL